PASMRECVCLRRPRLAVGGRLAWIGAPQRIHELLHALVDPPTQRLTLLLASTMAAFEAAVSDRPGGPAVDASEMGDDALHRPAGDVGNRRVCGPAASHLTDPLSLGGDDIYVVHGSQVTPPPGPDPSVMRESRRIRSPQGVSSACRVGAAIGGPYELVGFERSDVVPRCAPDLRGGWAG